MLYGLEWLNSGEQFPPECESIRIESYKFYAALFDINPLEDFKNFANRLIVNFDEYFHLPLLLGYQRLQTIKLADMVLGAPPSITVNDNDELTNLISDIRDQTDFDAKLYTALIDYSRFGTALFRIFNDDTVTEDKGNFAVWSPAEWYPVLKKDGTKRIDEQVLAWRVNEGDALHPKWYLEVQRHPVKGGSYFVERYLMDDSGSTVTERVETKEVNVGDLPCLVQCIANLPSTTNVCGTSDYRIINELVAAATQRMCQILKILDKHADPSMTGPATMLKRNEETQQLEFYASQFYAVSPGEEHPEYMTWDGQLQAAFQALEILLNQIYVMSEMGEAITGNAKAAGSAISGTAMRYKMVSPLEKARRVANSFTLPVKKLMATLVQISTGKKLRYQDINVIWEDSLPKDPREIAELSRLQSGAPQIIPLKHVLMENYDMDTVDAEHYIQEIEKDQELWAKFANSKIYMRDGSGNNPAVGPNVLEKGSINEPTKSGTKNAPNKKEDTK